MKKLLLICLLVVGFASQSMGQDKSDIILKEIQNLREDMNKRFEQVDKRFEQIDRRFEQVDKRFEQVERRFEQIDKRLDFLEKLVFVLMGLVFASPFIAIYLKDKQINETREQLNQLRGIIFVLRELATENEKLARALKAAGIM